MNLPRACVQALVHIFNVALSAGYFIDHFKLAKLIFIPKESQDNTITMNHRPISLLEVIGKLFEKKL